MVPTDLRPSIRERALARVLDRCRMSADLTGVVIADDQGFLVASSVATGVDANMLAAYAPFPFTERAASMGMQGLDFQVGDDTLHLGFIGPMGAWVNRAIRGVRAVLA
jgi:hypothetical protein